IENNWDQNGVDPGLVDLSDNGPDDPNLPDMHLKPNSAAIDAGAWLTTITSASGSGTVFGVVDAGYFMDGWGIIEGDLIQLADGQRARITDVNYETNTITVEAELSWMQNMGLGLAYEGSALDLGAYEFTPDLVLHGTPGDKAIRLDWTVNITLPLTSTWHIDYYTQTVTAPFTATDPISLTRSTVLTEHVHNYDWYTVTLHAMVNSTSWLSDTVRVMPTDRFVYLPLVLRGH
ncbi:MAG: hypothetical protein KAT70_07815, partial [Thermoplasmata archaeon]|nr:hypothetical protein [Thermoplasmata archaeon]